MLKRFDPDDLWREECQLAFAWKHCRDHKALATLAERFQPLVESIAAERFRASQLDRGVKATNRKQAEKNPELAGHYQDLVQAGQVGLIEAANRYDGRNRFATYASHWIFKRMAEYVRWNWNVVLMPEPTEWKVAKRDQIPQTIPNERLNPFENPYSVDKTAKRSRHTTISTPREDDDENSRPPEEWVVGRLHAGSTDYERDYFGQDHFESTEYQFHAHENMQAEARAIELETLSATCEARAACLTPRKFQIVRARFPWAIDVKNVPDREDEHGYPRKHTRATIGDALGISDEWVRRLETDALSEMRRSKAVCTCMRSEFWPPAPKWAAPSRFHLKPHKSNWKPPELPQAPDRYEFLVDRLVDLLGKVLKRQRKKRWLKPTFLYEEDARRGKLRPRADYLRDKKAYLLRKRMRRG